MTSSQMHHIYLEDVALKKTLKEGNFIVVKKKQGGGESFLLFRLKSIPAMSQYLLGCSLHLKLANANMHQLFFIINILRHYFFGFMACFHFLTSDKLSNFKLIPT